MLLACLAELGVHTCARDAQGMCAASMIPYPQGLVLHAWRDLGVLLGYTRMGGGWRWQALGMQREDLVLKAGGKANLGQTSSPMSSGALRMALEGDFTATAPTRGTSGGSAQPSHGSASNGSQVHPRLLLPRPLGHASTWLPVVKWGDYACLNSWH